MSDKRPTDWFDRIVDLFPERYHGTVRMVLLVVLLVYIAGGAISFFIAMTRGSHAAF
jgi:hypothetical protein